MTDEELQRLKADHDYWTAKHKALAESVELLAASARDLRATVEAEVQRDRERDQRDQKFLGLIADVLKHWANGGESR